jgi:hypothetical protein
MTWLIFYGEELSPCPIPKLEDHPLLVVCDSLFNIFAATLHIWRPFLHPQSEDVPCRGDRERQLPSKRYIYVKWKISRKWTKFKDCILVMSNAVSAADDWFAAQPSAFYLSDLKKPEQQSKKCVELGGVYSMNIKHLYQTCSLSCLQSQRCISFPLYSQISIYNVAHCDAWKMCVVNLTENV